MSETPYVPFYTSDFLAGTSGMTSSVKGVYITLLCLMYEAEGPLTQKWDMLARRCGCTLPAFERSLSVLQDDGKVEITEAGIWSPKCDKHIAERRERSNSAKAAAKKRWGKTEQKQGMEDAGAMRTQCQPEPEPKEIDKSISTRAMRFDEFWSVYPHRGGVKRNRKGASQKYALAVRHGVPEQTLIDGAKAYATDRRVIDGYARDPTTWLNQEGWTDGIEAASPSGARSDRQMDKWEYIRIHGTSEGWAA